MQARTHSYFWPALLTRLVVGCAVLGLIYIAMGAAADAALMRALGSAPLLTPAGAASESRAKPLTSGQDQAPRHAPPSIAGDENWSAVGSGVNSWVLALAVDVSSNIYAGGFFTTSGGIRTNYIAKWDGSSWSALNFGLNGAVSALAFDGSGNLYVGGYFTETCADVNCSAPGTPVNHVALWNGSTWSALLNGFNDSVYAFAVDGTNIYAGGAFTLGCGNSICSTSNYSLTHLAQWNGSSWLTVGSGTNGAVRALAVPVSNYLYVGGDFIGVCANPDCSSVFTGNYISLWNNGCCWSAPVGEGMNNSVATLLADANGNLYAGGSFTEICGIASCNSGNVTTNHVARWNGSNWSALGSGTNSNVNALAIDPGGSLYVAGAFWMAGGASANYIARWNGGSWSPLGSGFDSTVSALAVAGRNLYTGGFFSMAGGKPAAYIARWLLHLSYLPMVLK